MKIGKKLLVDPKQTVPHFPIYLIYHVSHFPIYLVYPVSHLPHFPFLRAIVFWQKNSQFSCSERVSYPCIFDKLAFLLYQSIFECSALDLSFLPCFSTEESFSSIQNAIIPAQTSSFCALATIVLHCTERYWFHCANLHPSL